MGLKELQKIAETLKISLDRSAALRGAPIKSNKTYTFDPRKEVRKQLSIAERKDGSLVARESMTAAEMPAPPTKDLRRDINDPLFDSKFGGSVMRAMDRPEDFNPTSYGKSWKDATAIEKGTAIAAEGLHTIANPGDTYKAFKKGLGAQIDISAELASGHALALGLESLGLDEKSGFSNVTSDLMHKEKVFGKQLLAGASGGLMKAETDESQGFWDELVGAIGYGVGMMTIIGPVTKAVVGTGKLALGGLAEATATSEGVAKVAGKGGSSILPTWSEITGATAKATATGVETIAKASPSVAVKAEEIASGVAKLLTSPPKIIAQATSKFPSVYKLLEDSAGFAAYSQLDPDLKFDWDRRIKALESAATWTAALGGTSAIQGTFKRLGASAITAYSLTKLEGGSDKDALISGVTMGVLGMLGSTVYKEQFGVSKAKMTESLKKASIDKINNIADTAIPYEATSKEISEAYTKAVNDNKSGAVSDLKMAQLENAKNILEQIHNAPITRQADEHIAPLTQKLMEISGNGKDAKKMEKAFKDVKTIEEFREKAKETIKDDTQLGELLNHMDRLENRAVAAESAPADGAKLSPELSFKETKRSYIVSGKHNGMTIHKVVAKKGNKSGEAAMERVRKEVLRKEIDGDKLPLEVRPLLEELPADLTSSRISDDVLKAVYNDFAAAVKRGEIKSFDTNKRIASIIGEMANRDLASTSELAMILKEHPMVKMEDVFQAHINVSSEAGKQLQKLSAMKKLLLEVNDLLPEGKRMEIDMEGITGMDKVMSAYKKIDNVRRGLLVTQIATQMRNVISQTMRTGLMMTEDAAEAVRLIIFEGKNAREGFAMLKYDMKASKDILTNASPETLKLIQDSMPALERGRLYSAEQSEAGLGGKVMYALGTLGRFQEYAFRNVVLLARVENMLSINGGKLKNVTDKQWASFVDEALEITWSSQPKGKGAEAIMGLWKAFPILTTVNPFPRFWLNGLTFMWEYNPTGAIKLMNKKGIQDVMKGDAKAWKSFAKASLGSGMLGAAFALRSSDMAGERWYEIKAGGHTIDVRPFAPFSTYLLLASLGRAAVGAKEQVSLWDLGQLIFGISRVAGTGLVIYDLFRYARTAEQVEKGLTDFLGAYLSGFSVPVRTLKDIVAMFDDTQAVSMYTKGDNIDRIFNPTIDSFPFVRNILPKNPSLTREGYLMNQYPGFRQFTGISVKDKTWMETEMDRLGVGSKELLPDTGDTQLDYYVLQKIGVQVEQAAIIMENDIRYQKASDAEKEKIIRKLFSTAKAAALAQAKHSNYAEFKAKADEEFNKLQAKMSE